MLGRQTEAVSAAASGIDTWPDQRALAELLAGQGRGIAAVEAALPPLGAAADLLAGRMAEGGRLIYIGAGSSGLIAKLDALELPATFGIPATQALALIAGGPASFEHLNGAAEDDPELGRHDISSVNVDAKDVVIGISASGSTIYTCAALKEARVRGAATIGIACNAGAPIFEGVAVAIVLPSGGEVLAGSTRMGAGTAQKAALNLLSTLTAMKLGHVHDGMMVNVRAENAKLRERAAVIVSRVAGVDVGIAAEKLKLADHEPKLAILLAAGAKDLAEAKRIISESKGHLRPALAWLGASPQKSASAAGTK